MINSSKKKLIWLECGTCSGNIISFYNSQNPSFDVLVNNYIDIAYNNSHMAKCHQYSF